MRNRHIPRLCRDCQAAMAVHQDACWRCGAQWASEEAPRTTLRLAHSASVGRGRNAIDVALLTTFGPVTLTEFAVRAA